MMRKRREKSGKPHISVHPHNQDVSNGTIRVHINRLSGHLATLQIPAKSTLGDLKLQTLSYLQQSLNEFVYDASVSIRLRFMLTTSDADANGFKELDDDGVILFDSGVTNNAELSLVIQKLAPFDPNCNTMLHRHFRVNKSSELIDEYLSTHCGFLNLNSVQVSPGCSCEFVSAIAQVASKNSTVSAFDFAFCDQPQHADETFASVSKLKSLQSMYIWQSSISSAGCEAMASALVRLTQLTSLGFFECRFVDFNALGSAWNQFRSLSSIHLKNCTLGHLFAPSLANFVSLKKLVVSDCHIDDAGCQALAAALTQLKSLEMFGLLNHRTIGLAGWQTLAPVLSSMACLETLDLSDNRLKLDMFFAGCSSIVPLAASSSSSSFDKLKKLVLDQNSLTSSYSEREILCSTLVKMKSLSDLSMVDMDIDFQRQESLGVVLRNMPALKIFAISPKQIGRADYCAALADELVHLQQLSFLVLSRNGIIDANCQILAPALTCMRSLRILFLSSNQIGPVGCSALAAVLPSMVSLKSLYLSNNNFGNAGCEALQPAFQSMVWLNEIDLSSNGIDDFRRQLVIQEIGNGRRIRF